MFIKNIISFLNHKKHKGPPPKFYLKIKNSINLKLYYKYRLAIDNYEKSLKFD